MKPEQHGTYLRWWHPENPSRELLLLAFQNCTRYIFVLLYAERYKLSLDVFYGNRKSNGVALGKLSDRASDSALSPSVTNTSNGSSWVARHFKFWKNCAWVPFCCGGWKLVRRTLDIYYFFYYYWWLLLFLVRASPWTVPISGYLFNVTGSSEKKFLYLII